MNGIFAASGIDYQRDVFLFLILKELIERKLVDAEMEIVVKDQNEQKIEIDFFISRVEKSREQKFLYEVKEGNDILKKRELAKVFRKFHRIYNKDNSYKFVLIYSVLAKESLKKLLDKPGEWIQKNVCQDRTVCSNPDNCLFPNAVDNILFLPRNILGEKLSKCNKSDIQLRIVEQIINILSEFWNNKNEIEQKAKVIYESMINEIKNKTRNITSVHRQTLSWMGKSELKKKIKLNSLFYTPEGFVEAFMNTDNFNDENKYPRSFGESPKDVAFKKFCEIFRLNLSIPH